MSYHDTTSNSEWERRKMYLLRSFLGYRQVSPDTSSVSEDASHTDVSLSAAIQSDSSESSSTMPSLIIEREPKRNRHDEPDEYYDDLFLRVFKLYKHLFVHKRNLSSFDELDSEGGSKVCPSTRKSSSPETRAEDWSIAEQEEMPFEEEVAKSSSSTKTGVSEGDREDMQFPPEPEEITTPPVQEMEVMRSQQDAMSVQFTPPYAGPGSTVISPKRATIIQERATASSVCSFGPDMPSTSTRKSRGRESGHVTRMKKKRIDKWEAVLKNFFVGPTRVFHLTERFPDDYQSTSSSD